MTRQRPTDAPRAFKLDEVEIERDVAADTIGPFDADPGQVPVLTPRPKRRRGPAWGRWLLGAIAGLVSLGIGLAVTDMIVALFARQDWLGWVALGLAGLAVLAALGLATREIFGLMRLAKLSRLRKAAEAPVPDANQARFATTALLDLYRTRPELAPARAEIAAHAGDIMEPVERIRLVERLLLPTLDAEASRLIGDAVKRVSVITAVSPAALIDLGAVLIIHLGLIRRLAELYGGRPGGIAMIGLSRRVVAHLALTGGIALGDDLVQQLLGHGLAARVSARLGEGVLNGLLTARIGLAALDVCRPLPFAALPRPTVSQVTMTLVSRSGSKDQKDEDDEPDRDRPA